MVIPVPKKIDLGISFEDRADIATSLAANLQGIGTEVPPGLIAIMEGVLLGMAPESRKFALAALKNNSQASSAIALARYTVEADQLQNETQTRLTDAQRKKQLEAFAEASPQDKYRDLIKFIKGQNQTSAALVAAAIFLLGGADKLSEAWARHANTRSQNEAAAALLAWSSGGNYSNDSARVQQASYSTGSGYVPSFKTMSEPMWDRPLREWQRQQEDIIWRDNTPIFPENKNDPRKVALDAAVKRYDAAAVDYRTGTIYVPGKGQVAPNGDVIQTPTQLAQVERQIVQLKKDAIIHDGVASPNGLITIRLPNGEEGAVVRVNPQTGKLETVLSAQENRIITQARRQEHQQKINSEATTIAAQRYNVAPSQVTREQAAAEVQYRGRVVPDAHAAVIRDTNQRIDRTIAEQDAIARQQKLNGIVLGPKDPKAAADANFVSSYGARKYWLPWAADKILGRDSVMANIYDNARWEGANDGNPHVARDYIARNASIYQAVIAGAFRTTIGSTPKNDIEGRDNARGWHRVASNIRMLWGAPDTTPPLPKPDAGVPIANGVQGKTGPDVGPKVDQAPAQPWLISRMTNAVTSTVGGWYDRVVGNAPKAEPVKDDTILRADVPTADAPKQGWGSWAYEKAFGKTEPPAPAPVVQTAAAVVPAVIAPTVTAVEAAAMDAKLIAAAQVVDLQTAPRPPLSRTTTRGVIEPPREKTTAQIKAELDKVTTQARATLAVAVARDGAANQSVETVVRPRSEAAVEEAARRNAPQQAPDVVAGPKPQTADEQQSAAKPVVVETAAVPPPKAKVEVAAVTPPAIKAKAAAPV